MLRSNKWQKRHEYCNKDACGNVGFHALDSLDFVSSSPSNHWFARIQDTEDAASWTGDRLIDATN